MFAKAKFTYVDIKSPAEIQKLCRAIWEVKTFIVAYFIHMKYQSFKVKIDFQETRLEKLELNYLSRALNDFVRVVKKALTLLPDKNSVHPVRCKNGQSICFLFFSSNYH